MVSMMLFSSLIGASSCIFVDGSIIAQMPDAENPRENFLQI